MVFGPEAPKGSTVEDGKTVLPPRKFQGPVRPGANVETFRRTGGSSSSNSNAAQQAAKRQAEILKQEQAKQRAIAEAEIKAAKTFAEKQRLARALVEQRKAQSQYKRIIQDRTNLIKRGASENKRILTDSSTGNKVEVTRWNVRNGDRVVRTKNLATGEIKYDSYARPRGGGNVRRIGSVVQKTTPQTKDIIKNLKNYKLNPIIKNNKVVGFNSNITNKTYPYNNIGINIFNKDVSNQQKEGKLSKTIKFFTPLGQPKLGKNLIEFKKANKPIIIKTEKEILRFERLSKENQKRKPGVTKSLYSWIINVNNNVLKEKLNKLNQGISSATIIRQEVPIDFTVNPVSSQITKVAFLGKQQTKGGKILTDIVFKTKKGTTGFVRGVTIAKGSEGTSVIAGRFGKIKVNKITQITKVKNLKSFVGAEKIKIPKSKLVPIKTIELLKNKKSLGEIKVIDKNVKLLQQIGVGKIATVGGKKFYKSGKMVKGIDFDYFKSISGILSKGDISKIIGKSITAGGAKSSFIGLIKGSKSNVKNIRFDATTKQQFSKALQKVIQSTSSALAKAEQQGAFNNIQKISRAASIIKQGLRQTPLRQTAIKRKTIQKIKQKTTTKIKQASRQKSITKARQKSKQMSKQKLRVKQKSRQVSKQMSKQASKQKLRVKMKLIQKQKNILKTSNIPKAKNIKNIKIPKAIRLPKNFKRKSLSKQVQTYFVVEKVRGKFKKLYPKPLTAKDAKDYAVYSIDNRLSKTAFFIPLGKSKKVIQPPKNIQGYFSKNRIKVRPYKIKYGKKKQLVNGFIEKRKYNFDRPGERIAAKKLRRTTIKRKITPAQKKVMLRNVARGTKTRGSKVSTIKRNVPRRRTTASKTTIKRKITPQQRRLLLLRLKRARAVRMRNLKR